MRNFFTFKLFPVGKHFCSPFTWNVPLVYRTTVYTVSVVLIFLKLSGTMWESLNSCKKRDRFYLMRFSRWEIESKDRHYVRGSRDAIEGVMMSRAVGLCSRWGQLFETLCDILMMHTTENDQTHFHNKATSATIKIGHLVWQLRHSSHIRYN